uniref:TonB-dependent transporter Oar-like beta-barrel domain-containing protein n=1 Tax=mine drainage metagenome TaxID=410659 RepID=E6QHS3_9ZZZZ
MALTRDHELKTRLQGVQHRSSIGSRLKTALLALNLLFVAGFAVSVVAPAAFAQTNISGDIAGNVTDPSGAAIANAQVTALNAGTGAVYQATANSNGQYRVSQLSPGAYTVSVTAPGFEKTTITVTVNAGLVAGGNFTLTVGKSSETVVVTANDVSLLHTDDAQISTTFTEAQVHQLPNPGNDLTFVAQTAPGSVMNTQSGYGNFSSFGLPATANTYTVNGGYYNDPFLNVNNSGATNLTLGNNDVDTVTVTSNAYNASFGGLGGAQVSEISRSGSNQFHGNMVYQWNGRVMNANDFFNKQSGTPRPFDNVNQWAAAVGGPIKRNRTFFFVNYEGLRIVLPTRSTVYAPDATYEATVLKNLTTNGLTSEEPIYKNIFSLYQNAPGYAQGKQFTSDAGGYGTVQFNGTAGNFTHEWLLNSRIDQTISDKDHLFGHATIDKGVQATYTSVLNPEYNALSPQPSYEGQLGETHTFTPDISNQFLFSTVYYRAVFTNTNLAASAALTPFSLIFASGDMSNNGVGAWPGGLNMIWPQGRNVTGYQFQDDVSITKGKHTVSLGWTMRRDDVTDFSPSEYTTSPEAYTTAGSFQQGYVDYWFEQFPTRSTQPVALYTMGWYVQDQWKAMPNLTITYGLRMEHNSNPICVTNCFARLSTDFSAASTSDTTAYNKIITYSQHQAMASLQTIAFEPRIGFAFLPFGANSHTTIRGGFGMFADAFPGQIADMFLNNAPTNVPFTIYGPAFGGGNNALVPTTPGSAYSLASASDKAFAAGFSTGASLSTLSTLNGFAAPNIVSAKQHISDPTYEEWSLAIEHQFTKSDAVSIQYVGNRSYYQPVLNNSLNVFNGGGASGFPELSTTSPANPNFSAVNEISSSAAGNYNGLVLSGTHRSANLTVTLNYVYSHALDEISNGGFDGFSGNSTSPDNPFNLSSNYGNADYDVRHYVSGSYLYTVPHFFGPRLLMDNWQFSGTLFHSTGLPFSVTDTAVASSLTNYNGPLYAKLTSKVSSGNLHCGGESASITPCGFTKSFAAPTDFAQSRRNQLFGPNFTDSDMSILKGFMMPHWKTGELQLGAQIFNLFNHVNFAQPSSNLASSNFGMITSAVNTPTSILGSFLGGDASPRLIQLTGKFNF